MGNRVGHFRGGVCPYIIHQLLPIVSAFQYQHFKEEKMMIHNITVENIKCGGCVNSIKTALLKIDGVQNVSIDKETETVTIDGTTEKTILVQALSKMGYPEKGNNDLLKKAKSYVSCAIGKMN